LAGNFDQPAVKIRLKHNEQHMGFKDIIEGQTARNMFGVYAVPVGLEDRPAVRKVMAGEVYEANTLRFMRAHAGDGDIIHAGTFFGDFLPALSSALAPQAKLWAFEPNPGSFDAAAETARLNRLGNVVLTNAALSNRQDTLRFRTHRDTGQALGGLSHVVAQDGPGVVTVASVMLDYSVPLDRKISILQLDVEGHEKMALRGAYHLLSRWRPIIIAEYFDKPFFFKRHFRDLNYVQLGKVDHNFVYVPEGSLVTL
jgi:FkbM family methyltransferase